MTLTIPKHTNFICCSCGIDMIKAETYTARIERDNQVFCNNPVCYLDLTTEFNCKYCRKNGAYLTRFEYFTDNYIYPIFKVEFEAYFCNEFCYQQFITPKYSRNDGGYVLKTQFGRTILEHRRFLTAEEEEHISVHHIDGIKTNNEKSNLEYFSCRDIENIILNYGTASHPHGQRNEEGIHCLKCHCLNYDIHDRSLPKYMYKHTTKTYLADTVREAIWIVRKELCSWPRHPNYPDEKFRHCPTCWFPTECTERQLDEYYQEQAEAEKKINRQNLQNTLKQGELL